MLSAPEVVELYFLETRCALLDIAATLDRLDRAAETSAPGDDPRVSQLYQALELLADRATSGDRVERLLQLFSDLD